MFLYRSFDELNTIDFSRKLYVLIISCPDDNIEPFLDLIVHENISWYAVFGFNCAEIHDLIDDRLIERSFENSVTTWHFEAEFEETVWSFANLDFSDGAHVTRVVFTSKENREIIKKRVEDVDVS